MRRLLAGLLPPIVVLGVLLGLRRVDRGLASWALLVGLGGFTLGRIVLPRLAHRAFRIGNFDRSAWLYGVLAWTRLAGEARLSARISRAACFLGREEWARALDVLGRIEGERLAEAPRAAWLNNRAYALVRGGSDPSQALAEVDRAIALRPDMTGFRHTRGLALLALGRAGEAVRELDAVWREQDAGAATPLFEAERSFDLGVAWGKQGEAAYAADYFQRARRLAPTSPWARRAEQHLPPGLVADSNLDDLG